ncbi:MAG: ThuA domain-containing protein [Verrucomicrobiota bacterium]
MKQTIPLLIFVLGLLGAKVHSAEPVRVLVWDERQDKQAEAYDDYLGNEIANRLGELGGDMEIRSVGLDDPEQGLAAENLDWADVVIWWGHVRQWEISPETAQRKIVKRLKQGTLDLIFLHSAHWATPFMEAMNERTMIEAKERFPTVEGGKPIEFEFVRPAGRFPPAMESMVTPSYLALKRGKNTAMVRVDLPNCCFPDYRPDGEPSKMTVTKPGHPIAKDLPKTFEIPMTEMYNEPFHIPEPDEVVFEEHWEQGEHFRSGLVWEVGEGTVFYFRPGHEQYPVFKQREMIRILANACRWMGSE